ncbi:MAG: hypothetical protein M4579_006041 [Chaenotheca gracillima]|nr:MAG: hypothetical protein M4579_006041 [Chaenotheca gracillima]
MALSVSISTAFLATAVVLVLSYYFLEASRNHLTQGRFMREYGCQLPVKYPHKDPFFGFDIFLENFKSLKQKTFLSCTWKRYQRMDRSTYRSIMLGEWVINTIEPENVKAMISTKFEDFDIGWRRRQAFSQLLGNNGIFLADGPQWKKTRALMRPNFTKKIWTNLSVFEGHLQNLLARVPRDGSTFDLQDLFFSLTLDSASTLFFGKSINSLTAGASDAAVAFAEAFSEATPLMVRRLRLGFISGFLPAPALQQHCNLMRSFIKDLVRDAVTHKSTVEEDDSHYTIMDALLKDNIDKEEICDILLNALLGGRDTTAGLLGAVFFVLARRPDIWNKLQAEIAEHCGDRKPTYEQLLRLKYLRYTVNEALRLYPIVPTNQRVANKDTVLPVGGGTDGHSPVFVKKGTTVLYHLYSMHRRHELYGPDANEFRPERWDDPPSPWSFLPFNGGPRVCLGQSLALTEASYTIVRLLQEFRGIEARDDRPWTEGLKLTCASGNGVLVSFLPKETS